MNQAAPSHPIPSHPRFQSLARASILSSVENKHTQYVPMADRRAQGLLTMAAGLAPVATSQINGPEFFPAVVAAEVPKTSTTSATTCSSPNFAS